MRGVEILGDSDINSKEKEAAVQTEVTLSEFHKTIKSKINGLTAEQVSTLASNTGGSLGYSATTVMRWFEGRTAPHHAVHESLFSGIDAEKRKLRLK